MDDRLSLSVTHADGRVTRWGPDEVDAGSIPSDLQFSTGMPGGYRDLSCSLLRRIDLDYSDQGLFDNVRAYGPGNQTAWDGRFTQFPRSHGQGFSVTPGAVGWAAHLRDDPSFTEVYIDRDLSHWQGPVIERRSQLVAANVSVHDFRIDSSPSGSPGLTLSLDGAWSQQTNCEAFYMMPAGLTPGALKFTYAASSQVNIAGDTNWKTDAYTVTSDGYSTFTTLNLDWAGTSNSGTVSLTGTDRSGFLLRLYYTIAAGGNGVKYDLFVQNLRVSSTHGLTVRGTAPNDGYFASDMIGNVISRGGSPLDPSGIETTDFVIPHAVFPDPTTAEDAISLLNGWHLWEYGVYDDRVFFYRPPDTERLVWEARLDQGAFLDLEGDTAEQVYNGVYVSYQDASGTRKTLGPTGATADATSALLADTSDTNPVNAHGIPRRWARLEISQPTTQAGAEQLGYVWLSEHSLPQRRGNLTLTGSITHPTEGPVPAWRPRAGDSVKITDGGVSDVARRIISTQYNHGTRSISLSLDNTSLKLDAILERMGVGLVGVL